MLLDAVSDQFAAVADEVARGLPVLAVRPRVTLRAGTAVERIRQEYGIESREFVKPGVGETTRVLLRRVPWKILIREPDHPDHAHLRLLAAQRGVPIEVVPGLAVLVRRPGASAARR